MFGVAKSDRAVVVPAFGRLLVRARGQRTPGSVVAKIHSLSPTMHGFTRPQLDRYEAGMTPRPDPVALYFLAQLYAADVSEWLAALAREREATAEGEEAKFAVAHAKGPPAPEVRTVRRRRAGS